MAFGPYRRLSQLFGLWRSESHRVKARPARWAILTLVILTYGLGWFLHFGPRGADKWTYVGVSVLAVFVGIAIVTLWKRRKS